MPLRFQQKLIIPSAARPLVERRRLVARLEESITTKQVVALAALAGWGKTTALAQWAAHSSLPVAWYTLDNTDRNPHLFLDYLLHAVIPFVPAAAGLAAQLEATPPHVVPDLFRATALEIAAAPTPFAIVLDDFHVLEDDLAPPLPGAELVRDLLADLADYAPNCHLVLASRTPPNLRGLIRLVAQQRATVFDYVLLQLTAGEVQRLADLMYGLTLSDAGAQQLTAQLSGWVTGIALSLDQATQLHGQPTIELTADTRHVYDFFAEQIIAPLPRKLQRFLEDTSVLEDLSPQRCDSLRGTNDSARFLNEIAHRGLFTSRRGGWLSFHSLFRDFLRARLTMDRRRERMLLRRAGDLYRDEEDIERAVDCYLAAGAEDQAIALLRAAIPRFRQKSRQMTLLACFERLNAYAKRLDRAPNVPPDLLLAQARVYSDLALWERAYLAIQLAETVGDAEIRWEAHIRYADALCLQGNYTRAQAELAQVPRVGLPPPLQLEYHITAGRVQILGGMLADAIESFEQAQTLAPTVVESANDPSKLALIYDNLGLAYAWQGDWHSAVRCLQRADACWQACGNNGRRTMTLNNLGSVAMLEGRYTEARSSFEVGLRIAQQTAHRREEAFLRYSMAELDAVEGHLDQALEGFTESHALAVRIDVPSRVVAAAVGALWVTALQGDRDAAQLWQQALATIASPSQPDVRGRLALSKGLLALQQPCPDLAVISELIQEATDVETSLLAPERANLALLRATLSFEQDGWAAAAPAWEAFVAHTAGLPDTLLWHFVRPHRKVFDAAAHTAPLAHHLITMLERTAPRRWQVRALGAFACLRDGVSCEVWPLHQAVLVRLLDAGPQGLAVERLWEAVWGDSSISMQALHQALYRLRGQTGLAVAARDGICTIRSPWGAIEYDVELFERALTRPIDRDMLERTIALYGGDFLPSAPLSAALWVDARRSQLQQRYLDALEQLARIVEDEVPDQAIHYYHQVLQLDGCREQTAVQLMRLAARLGKHSLVNTTFEHLKGALRTLGTTPDPATALLYQHLQ